MRTLRPWGGTRALPTTSYGYTPPGDATARGWRCPADGCGYAGDTAPRRWPFACTECGGPTDPDLDEPWAHDARGPWLRHELATSEPGGRRFWEGSLLAWMYRDALRDGDLAVAEEVRADGHRFVATAAPHEIGGDLHHPVVRDSLDHGLIDVAIDELLFWNARAITAGAEDDNGRRTNCRQLLSGLLDLLEHPDGTRHPRAPELVTHAARLRDAIESVLTADLIRRSRSLRADGFAAAGPVPGIPDGHVEQMVAFGRYSFDPMRSDIDPGQIWSRIVGPRYPTATADPDGFCRDLAAQVLPVGGWAVYGAQRLVVELVGGEYGGHHFLLMQDAALEWLRHSGVSAAQLTGYEHARWIATHGAGTWEVHT